MSRSFRDLLKLSAPVLLSAALLSGCGSGSSGSADLDSGGGPPVTQPPPPVTVAETFDFESTVDWFVVGTPPIHARFSGGKATSVGAGAWIVPSGETGVVDFGTPASAVKFTTQDNFTPTASTGTGAQKTGVLARSGNEKVDSPFGDQDLFIRGLAKDWTPNPTRKLVEAADNILEVTLPLTTAIVAGTDVTDEPGEFKIAAADWSVSAVNCGAGSAGKLIEVGKPLTLSCGPAPGNLELTITEDADYKFRFDATGSDKTAPMLTITKVVDDGGGGGGEPEPEDSTIIRIHTVTVFASAAGPAGVEAVEEIKGLGSVAVDKLFASGDNRRITKIEIVNTGTAGDIGIADFSWTADARYALATEQVDIFYARPAGSVAGTQIVVGGKTYDCVTPSPDPNFSCVVRDVEVTPFANAPMNVQNVDGKTESIIFNGGSGDENVYAYSGNAYASTGSPLPSTTVSNSAAHWVSKNTVLYNPPSGTARVEMLFSPDASIVAGAGGIGGTFQTIATASGTNPQPAFNNQLHSYAAWTLQGVTDTTVKDIARGQLVVVARGSTGQILASTRVQSAGALDDIYAANAYGKTLGVSYASGVPSLAVWAPTALKSPKVSVNLYDDPADTTPQVFEMELDEASGVWSVTGAADWNLKYYTISLRVFSYATNSIVTNEVTDPYSVSLSMNSTRSQFVDLNDAAHKPPGWDELEQPDNIEAPEDVAIYELHVRDFSVADGTVPADDRGKFTAFGVEAGATAGRQHLKQLAEAGLTHVHILPAFDIATVEENPAERVDLDTPDGVNKLCQKNPDAASLCATDGGKTVRKAIEDAIAANQLQKPAQIMQWIRQLDGFNWGYDPFHFGVPEGSYSTNPDGPTRIREFRDMVMGLHDLGLRTAMDVVYNHTNRSGQDPKSVLDRIVPGYYHRRNITDGTVTSGTCCADTATEFKMMEKLMVDTGKSWVRDYKISSFRFDLMGTHPLESMIKFRDAVQAIEPSTYIYGEGWNCCGGENDIRFKSARQANLGGTGIGSFSDRMRDMVRGGGPFDTPTDLVEKQGFVSGWFYDPNQSPSYIWQNGPAPVPPATMEIYRVTKGSPKDRQFAIAAADNIRVWLAGGLSGYRLQDSTDAIVAGQEVAYPVKGNPGAQGSGYTKDPQEAINYIDKHDNQTFYDLSAYKNPAGTSPADRVRVHNMGNSLVILAQGIPFLHAGTDIMRSKSGDRDSYDSGDWHNELNWPNDPDWSVVGSKWAQGLPIADKNSDAWPILLNKYLDTTTRPGTTEMQRSFDHVKEMLRIRKSSTLFRLSNQEQVDLRLKFYNTGSTQLPGLIAMGIDGCTEPNFMPGEGAVMLIFNASDEDRTLNLFGTEAWTLHPVLVSSTDPVVRNARHDANGFFVPARTTAVFQRAVQRSCAPYPRDMFVRGSFNDWGNPNPTEVYKLVFLGGKEYAVSAPIGTAEAHQFKIADAGWSPDTNCGVTADGVSISLGLPMTLTCADGTKNIGFNAAVAGNYTFGLNATSTVNPVLTVTRSPPAAPTVFIRGLFGDWGTTLPMAWDGEAFYTANVAATTTGATQFKIATGDWASLNCGGAPSTSPTVTIGEPFALTCGDGTTNLGINFTAAGDYVFSVNATNQSAPTLTVEPKPVDVFVRGLGGDWSDGAQNMMSYLGSGTYRLDKLVVSGDAFKIASSDWATVNCGGTSANKTVTLGTPFAMACGDGTENLGIATTVNGTYRFKYTRSDNKLLVTGP